MRWEPASEGESAGGLPTNWNRHSGLLRVSERVVQAAMPAVKENPPRRGERGGFSVCLCIVGERGGSPTIREGVGRLLHRDCADGRQMRDDVSFYALPHGRATAPFVVLIDTADYRAEASRRLISVRRL